MKPGVLIKWQARIDIFAIDPEWRWFSNAEALCLGKYPFESQVFCKAIYPWSGVREIAYCELPERKETA